MDLTAGAKDFAMTLASIRSFTPADEERVRDICFATALFGRPMPPAVADRNWLTDALLGYHFAAEPESLLVAEADGNVIGYLAGCADPRRHQRWFRQKQARSLVLRAVFSRQIVAPGFWKLGLAALGPSWGLRRSLRKIAAAYPAFLHVNLDADWQGQGIGRRLLDHFAAQLRERHVPGVHVTTATVAGRAFFARNGFALVAARPIRAVLGLPPGLYCLMARTP